MIELPRLVTLLQRFPRLTVGLIGDLFLDRYLEIDSDLTEVSIETGLDAYQVTSVRNQPGALGTVMTTLSALGGGRLIPVTVIGDDGHGYDVLRQLQSMPVDTSHILQREDRLTPTYTKPLLQNVGGLPQELNRLDVRTRQPLSAACRELVCSHLCEVFSQVDGLIVLDQIDQEDEGVIHTDVRNCLAMLVRENPERLVYIDSRRCLSRFDFGTLKANESEVIGVFPGETDAEQAARRLAAKSGRVVYCTRGESGSLVAHPDGSVQHARGYAVDGPVDIVGAGDSATSAIVLATLAGADPLEAASIGNLVASITVQQLGTTGTATAEQVINRWHETRV